MFGDGWDSPLQYEDKIGNVIGCYIDRHFIEKTEKEIDEYYRQQGESLETWIHEQEKEGGGDDGK